MSLIVTPRVPPNCHLQGQKRGAWGGTLILGSIPQRAKPNAVMIPPQMNAGPVGLPSWRVGQGRAGPGRALPGTRPGRIGPLAEPGWAGSSHISQASAASCVDHTGKEVSSTQPFVLYGRGQCAENGFHNQCHCGPWQEKMFADRSAKFHKL